MVDVYLTVIVEVFRFVPYLERVVMTLIKSCACAIMTLSECRFGVRRATCVGMLRIHASDPASVTRNRNGSFRISNVCNTCSCNGYYC